MPSAKKTMRRVAVPRLIVVCDACPVLEQGGLELMSGLSRTDCWATMPSAIRGEIWHRSNNPKFRDLRLCLTAKRACQFIDSNPQFIHVPHRHSGEHLHIKSLKPRGSSQDSWVTATVLAYRQWFPGSTIKAWSKDVDLIPLLHRMGALLTQHDLPEVCQHLFPACLGTTCNQLVRGILLNEVQVDPSTLEVLDRKVEHKNRKALKRAAPSPSDSDSDSTELPANAKELPADATEPRLALEVPQGDDQPNVNVQAVDNHAVKLCAKARSRRRKRRS